MPTDTHVQEIAARAAAKHRELERQKLQLERQLREVQIQLEDVTFMLGMIKGQTEGVAEGGIGVPSTKAAGRRGRKSNWRNPDRDSLLPLVKEVIGVAGRPLARREILSALKTRHDVEIKGEKPHVMLTTMLWRMRPDLTSIPGRGYWDPRLGAPPGFGPK